MKYIYLLFGLIIIYLLYCYYRKYGDQENFDPSLVPVSSIVTLAKVAQKLVDGGGTLTNPGNLQIGLPSGGAVGNLYVTGTNTVDGNTTIKGTTAINSLLTANGGISTTTIGATDNIAANSFSTINGNVSINNGLINLTSDGTGGLYFLNSGNPGAPVYNKLYMGNTNVTGDFSASGNSTVNGTTTLNGSTRLKSGVWHTDSEGNKRLHFGLNTNSFYESANGWHNFRNSSDVDTMTIDPSGNLNAGKINNFNLNNLVYNTINIVDAWYGDSWTGDTVNINNAVRSIASIANSNGVTNSTDGISCNYIVGQDINGNHYNTQNNGNLYWGQNAWIKYKCGIGQNIKTANNSVEKTITLSCP